MIDKSISLRNLSYSELIRYLENDNDCKRSPLIVELINRLNDKTNECEELEKEIRPCGKSSLVNDEGVNCPVCLASLDAVFTFSTGKFDFK
jgi:hypothetical protein